MTVLTLIIVLHNTIITFVLEYTIDEKKNGLQHTEANEIEEQGDISQPPI